MTQIKKRGNGLSGTAKNILVLAMSTFNYMMKVNYFKDEAKNGEVYTGISQLEPITKSIITKLQKSGKILDRVIVMNTDQTENAVAKEFEDEDKKTISLYSSPYEFYKTRIKEWAINNFKELYKKDTIVVEDVKVDEDSPEEGIINVVGKIVENYSGVKNNKSSLFIDTQGGFRDVVFVMTSVIKMLKVKNISPDGIYSISFDPRNDKENPNIIKNKKQSYQILDFVSGMDEFINYGRCKQLCIYYKEETNKNIKKVLKEIQYVSKSISICNPNDFVKSIEELMSSIKNYEKSNEIFDIFVNDIKREYDPLFVDGKINYIKIVQWCMKKEFYQQALTFIEAKFPDLYVQKKYFYYQDCVEDKISAMGPKWKAVNNKFFDSYWRKIDELIKQKYFEYIKEKLKVDKREIGTYLRRNPNNFGKSLLEKYKKETNENFNKIILKEDAAFIYHLFKLQNVKEFQSHEEKYRYCSYVKYANLEVDKGYKIESDLSIDGLKKLDDEVKLHCWLKQQRNSSNHAVKDPDRESLTFIEEKIRTYIKQFQELEDYLVG